MMDIIRKARRLEHTIARTVDEVARRLAQSAQRDPLAVMLAIVEAIEHETQPGGRGACVFPFTRIKASIAVSAREDRARFDAVFAGPPSLEQRIVDRLTLAGCAIGQLTVKTAFCAGAADTWTDPRFHLEFTRGPHIPEAPADTRASRIVLKVVQGTAGQEQYAFSLARIDIGRCAELRDRHNGLVRINHVAFADDQAPVNRSVSRRQAHITCDRESGVYRIFDDRSTRGTCIVRDGRTIRVPAGSRGVRLESGDEIVLGGARLAVSVRGS
jgi:hypothetical protein